MTEDRKHGFALQTKQNHLELIFRENLTDEIDRRVSDYLMDSSLERLHVMRQGQNHILSIYAIPLEAIEVEKLCISLLKGPFSLSDTDFVYIALR